MPRIFPIHDQRSNEELFFDYYPQLLKWALQLSRLDRDDAEDLVQDFYLQVTHINVVLARVDEVDPYLFKILRNLHYSRMRRQGKNLQHELSIVDFDSLERGLASVDRNGLLIVHSNLKHICRLACQRKEISRAASIFILRFFLGYYSSEVMKIAHMTRMGVDRALQVARREARLYLDKPNAIRQQYQDNSLTGKNFDSSHDLFLELRQVIFNSCGGPCLQRAVLVQHYTAESPSRFSVGQLAHLVSCNICLDQVNAILGLPLLDERSPDDTIGRDNPPGSGKGEGSGFSLIRGKKLDARTKHRKTLERRRRELLEHRPASLELAINGETKTTQRVTAEVGELELTLNRTEVPDFIEVFSEQGIRLAYLQVTEPTSSPNLEQREHVALSDRRSLDLTVSFANDLSTIRVVYKDPVFAQAVDELDEDDPSLFLVSREPRDTTVASTSVLLEPITVPLVHHWLSILKNTRLQHVRTRMNPLLASVSILAFVSVLCFFFWMRSGTIMTASTFLDRAQAQDASAAVSTQPGVIFQRIRIKTPGRTTERTLYRDLQHRRHVREQALDASDARLRTKLAEAGVDWNDPLSAVDYHDWHRREAVQTDLVKRISDDLLMLTTSVNASGVVSESLSVRQSDFHTVGRTIELRDYGTVEIAELNYDVMPWGAVNPDWSEPLLGQAVIHVPSTSAALRLPHVPSDLELAEAELAARTILNQLHADTGEQIHLTRSATGIEIKGVVDTNARKQELLSHLASLPNVHPSILSVEEIGVRSLSRGLFGGEQIIQVSSVESQPSPLEKYLRDKNLPTDQLAFISHSLLDGSLKISQAEVHFSELQPRLQEANQLPGDQRSELTTLSHSYLGAIETGLDANKRTLLSLGFGIENPTTAIPETSDPEEEIDAQIRHYRQLCLELISSGTEQPRPAAAIAEELRNTGEQIRLHLATIYVAIPQNPS